jgi:hypothetical protein
MLFNELYIFTVHCKGIVGKFNIKTIYGSLLKGSIK